jgi:hypothetical protein
MLSGQAHASLGQDEVQQAAEASCPVTGFTCYNKTYYYSVTAVVAVTGYPNPESTATNKMSGIVKRLFVTANNKSRPYGSANPVLDYSFTGLDNFAGHRSICNHVCDNSHAGQPCRRLSDHLRAAAWYDTQIRQMALRTPPAR